MCLMWTEHTGRAARKPHLRDLHGNRPPSQPAHPFEAAFFCGAIYGALWVLLLGGLVWLAN